MKEKKEMVFWAAAGIILVGLIGWFLVGTFRTVVPEPSSGETSVSTETGSVFSIDPQDALTVWTIPSLSVSDAVRTQKQEQITALASQVGKGLYTNYDIFVQIAQYYEMVGDGKNAFTYYESAIKNNPERGVAYVNVGNLMAKLGAFHTARAAYAKAVAVEPGTDLFWYSYVNYIAAYEPNAADGADIFTAAKKATKNAPDILIAEANWLASIGHFAAAIADWKLVRQSVGEAQQTAIDAKIARLQTQL